MRIGLTGGGGFIGSAIAAALRAEDHSVKLTDIRGANPGHIRNVLNPEDCALICRGADVVIHCAASHNALITSADPVAMISLNIEGTVNMLNAAASEGVRRFVYLSSGKVYGDASYRPSRESDLPRPKDPYALSKFAGESYLESFQRKHGLECISIRPFSVYGPGQDLRTGYIGMLLEGLLNRTTAHLPGEAGYLRDFVHIGDVARLCSLAATRQLPRLTAINAGSSQATSLGDIAKAVGELAGEKIHTAFRDPSPGTLTRSCGDMGLAYEQLGYQPEIDLKTGLSETIQWFRSRGLTHRAFGA